MIKSFRHNGLENFFYTDSTSGIQPDHAKKLKIQLATLNSAAKPTDLKTPPGWRLHQLQGKLKNRWSIIVSGNWRITFEFKDGHAYVVDYEDYH